MRKLLMIPMAAALPVLATTVLVTRSGTGTDHQPARRTDPAATAPSPTSTTASPATVAASTDETDDPAEIRFVCPAGGMDEVTALQHAVDEGHQPWRTSAPDVAAACTFGNPGTTVEPAGTNRYRVTQANTGQSAIVDVSRPLGPDSIWVVTRVTPAATAVVEASCSTDALLPATRRGLEQEGTMEVVTVTVEQCQNGYARVFAVPDNSRCGQPGGGCLDNEQVFLTATTGGWSYLTSGSGISCATDDLGLALSTACHRLGLR